MNIVTAPLQPINNGSARARRLPHGPGKTPANGAAFLVFLAASAAVAVGLAAPARGQGAPPDAAVILAEIQARYGAITALRARFEQRYVHRLHAREDRWRGRIAIRRPARVRIDYDEPRGRTVVSDGATLIAFDPSPSPGVWWEQPVDADALPIALGLLDGSASIEAQMDARTLDASATGFVGTVVELRPRVATPAIDRVLLYVDRDAARRGRVHRMMIVDPAGNTNRFDLLDQREGGAVPPDLFSWRPPAAARRVEP